MELLLQSIFCVVFFPLCSPSPHKSEIEAGEVYLCKPMKYFPCTDTSSRSRQQLQPLAQHSGTGMRVLHQGIWWGTLEGIVLALTQK